MNDAGSSMEGVSDGRGHHDYCFTLFIPTFNRADKLGETLESVSHSTFRDFEALVIDDGSTDRTEQILSEWKSQARFPLRYIRQENMGKTGAHNTALGHARGFLFMTLDSGDLLLPDALQNLWDQYERIPAEARPGNAGVAALCLKENGELSGLPYAVDGADATFLEMDRMRTFTGEKRLAVRTAVMRQFPYPRFPGEKHVRPDLIFKRMAHSFHLRFVNIPVQVNRREPDGITANIVQYRLENPRGFRLYFLEEITLHREYYSLRKRFGDHWRYVRFSLHSGLGLLGQAREVEERLLWLSGIPMGVGKWLADLLRVRTGRKVH
ncbi:MAG: glycosyltransferase family 2 protein [bacterium]|nr:MAG: glycosyltransferase family 2 protein [bacterium]